MVVDSAKGDYFDAFYKKPTTTMTMETGTGTEKHAGKEGGAGASESLLNPLFDGSASWFTYVFTIQTPSPSACHFLYSYAYIYSRPSVRPPARTDKPTRMEIPNSRSPPPLQRDDTDTFSSPPEPICLP